MSRQTVEQAAERSMTDITAQLRRLLGLEGEK